MKDATDGKGKIRVMHTTDQKRMMKRENEKGKGKGKREDAEKGNVNGERGLSMMNIIRHRKCQKIWPWLCTRKSQAARGLKVRGGQWSTVMVVKRVWTIMAKEAGRNNITSLLVLKKCLHSKILREKMSKIENKSKNLPLPVSVFR